MRTGISRSSLARLYSHRLYFNVVAGCLFHRTSLARLLPTAAEDEVVACTREILAFSRSFDSLLIAIIASEYNI